MTSTELKHQVKIQEWSVNVQNCRSSGLPVKAWCAENGIPTDGHRNPAAGHSSAAG